MREDGVQEGFFEDRTGLRLGLQIPEGLEGKGGVGTMGTCQVRWGFQTSGAKGGAWRVI